MGDSLLCHMLLYDCLSCDPSCDQKEIRPIDKKIKSKFLSSLALILNGDGLCTAVYASIPDRIIYIARNGSITAHDQRYFNRFFRLIRIYAILCLNNQTTQEIQWVLNSLVFEYNSNKITTRLAGRRYPEMIDALSTIAKYDADQKLSFARELQTNQSEYTKDALFTEKLCYFEQGRTAQQYVDFLLETLAQFLVARDQLVANRASPTDEQLLLATGLAERLYHSRLFRHILGRSSGTIAHGVVYFEKTSAHKRSIDLLFKCMRTKKQFYGPIYQNISWKLIPPIEKTQQLNISPKQAFEKLFTNLAHSSNQNLTNAIQTIQMDEFYQIYFGKLKTIDDNLTYVAHLHVEIFLIDYLLKNNIRSVEHSDDVEIGISKLPCLLCSYYIQELNRKHNRYFYHNDATDGKIDPMWMYRPDEDPLILDVIEQKLIGQIQHLLTKLCLRSDRKNAKKSDDNDTMSTSLDDDEFDRENSKELDLLMAKWYVLLGLD